MRALIVCHAGSGSGLGHLTRARVIAEALTSRFGAIVRLVVQGEGLRREDLRGFSHRLVPRETSLLKVLTQEGVFDLVLLDLQPAQVPADLSVVLLRWRESGSRVVAIDGLLAWRSELDLIFLPSFYFKPPADLQDGAPIVYGWDCFLLNSDWDPAVWRPGRQVLALTGGSDVTQLGKTWPFQLDQALPKDVTLHWVTGPFSSRLSWAQGRPARIVEHVAPECLLGLMQQVNYAVTVFGVSFFELLANGVPTVVFSPYGTKDAPEMTAIAEAGVAIVATNERDAILRLNNLLSDEQLAERLSKKSRAILARPGEERLCAEISSLMLNSK
jgi:spore coat polysaccharide biosynthesis predicted glycosyltransferase SpsG